MARDDTQTDALGRELRASTTSSPQTVTQFAVEQGVIEKDAPGVTEAIDAEKARAEAGTARAEQVSEMLAPAPATEEDSGE